MHSAVEFHGTVARASIGKNDIAVVCAGVIDGPKNRRVGSEACHRKMFSAARTIFVGAGELGFSNQLNFRAGDVRNHPRAEPGQNRDCYGKSRHVMRQLDFRILCGAKIDQMMCETKNLARNRSEDRFRAGRNVSKSVDSINGASQIGLVVYALVH